MTPDNKLADIEQRGYKLDCDENGWYFIAVDIYPPHIISFYSDDDVHAVHAMTEFLAGIDALARQE